MSTLHTYLPHDRRRALSLGEILPDRTSGSALFADISGFTPLTETLTQKLGQRRGIEELTRRINAVYDALIAEIEKYGGSVIGFAGDAITCWFDGDGALRAVTAALALQGAMAAFPILGLKVAVTTGPARRFAVGNPAVQFVDALAGGTIARLSTAEHLAASGEVLIDPATAASLADSVSLTGWRLTENGERFAVVRHVTAAPSPSLPEPSLALDAARLQPWILPAIFEREQSGLGAFLTELRPAVALFMSFSGIAYDHDPDAGAKLDALIVHAQTILTRYEGALLQLNIGDKGSYLYAAFGAPVAHEDDARRAVKAALELRTAAVELDYLASVQIGVSQGTVRAGAYGGATRQTYGVLGDDVNLAARLMSTANPGEILVSQAVYESASGEYTFKAYPPVRIKGKAAPLPVFAVTGERRRRAIRLEEPQYALPMMGRQAELALIDEKLELALQGKGQVIGIVAEAGMGKSRLMAEVIRLAHRRGFAGYGGACESSGMNTPYLVWKPIWQAFFDVDRDAPVRRQIRRLRDQVEESAPFRVPAIPVLAPLLDISIEDNDFTRVLEPKDRRNVLTVLLEDCLKAAAAEKPLLFVLEDLHWIDDLSRDLLETLARVGAPLPICFVLAYRPPETARLPAARVESLTHFLQVKLDRLAASEAEGLIRAKLAQLFPARAGELPEMLLSTLTARTEGNPFYVEELLNYLRDRNINPFEEETLGSFDLPPSLYVLILSRLDRLSESEKVTLKTASVIGRLFSLRWLHGYYPALGEVERVKADLAELARLDLTPLDTPEPDLAYVFKHTMIRDVAYESLTYAMRGQLHEQLAEFIETQDAGRNLDLLAFHYSHSENRSKQRYYLKMAGDAAQAAFANEAALDYYAHLLPLLEDPRAQIEVHLKRGEVLELLGRWTETEADYRAALAASETIADVAVTARCQHMLGTLYRLRGDYPEALTWLELARTAFTALNDQAGLALAQIEIGRVWFHKGEHVNAQRELETGLVLARGLTDKSAAALALNNLGSVAGSQGDYAAARRLFEESLALRRETGDRRGISASLNNLGVVANRQGDYASARALYEESLALRREMGDKWGISMSLTNLANMAHYQSDYALAQALHERSLALNREMGDKWSIARALINVGNLAVEQGDVARAQTIYQESMALCREIGDTRTMVYDFSGLAAVAAHQSDLAKAARLAAFTETQRLKMNQAWDPIERRIYEGTVVAARAELDGAAFDAAWAEGEQMSLDEAIDYALAA